MTLKGGNMKVLRRDLDQEILQKIDQLDNVLKTFDEAHPDGFVSYGKDGFFFKKTNDTFLKRVYDENEIASLENSIDSKDFNVKSSKFIDMRADKKMNAATSSFIYKTEFTSSQQFDGKILLYKSLDNIIFLLTDDGKLHKLDKNTISVDILKILEDTFNLTKKIFMSDIVDFEILDEDTVIVGTSHFGVYKVKISTKEIELLFLIDNLRKLKLTYTKTLFVISDDFCAQYDIATGNRIERYMNIHNRRQFPLDADNIDGDIFVLAVPAGSYNLDNILHLWKLDDGKVSYNNMDSRIEKVNLDNRYQTMFVAHDSKYIYLSGLYNSNPFIVTLDRSTLRVVNKHIYKELLLDDYTDLRAVDGAFMILSGDMLYVLDSESITERFKLPSPCQRIKIFNGEVVATAGNKLVKFQMTNFERKADVLLYNIFSEEEACNNIDIFVKGATRTERIVLVDTETGREIIPSYYMVFRGSSVIKLMNCKSKKIMLKLTVTPTSKIDGLVVRKNKMFLR